MKNLIAITIVCLMSAQLYAQTDSVLVSDDREKRVLTYSPSHNDSYDRTHSIFIWVPGILTRSASWFIDKDEEPELKTTLKYIGGITVRVLSGDPNSKKWHRKTIRWGRRIARKKLDDMVIVKSDDAQVRIKAGCVDKGMIENFAVLVDADDAAVFITSKGKIDLKRMMNIINGEDSDSSFRISF